MGLYLRIGKRNKLEDELLQLLIVQNPHSKEPKTLFREIKNEITKLTGLDDSELDRAGLQRLKQKMFIDRKKYKK